MTAIASSLLKASILLAEDSPTQAEQLRSLLADAGFRVAVAGNGREALELLERQPPDLVLTDVVMPEIDGYQLCRAVKGHAATGGIPVILVTTLSDPRDVVRGLECGADNFIVKPYEAAELLARVEFALLNRSLARHDEVAAGVEIFLGGERHFITSGRLQILNLLLTTYDTAVTRNNELERARDQLREANERLEERVRQRTAELTAEVEVRRRTERSLQASRAEIAAIFESTPVPTLIVNHDGRVVRANRALAQLAGDVPLEAGRRQPGDLLCCINALTDPGGCGASPSCRECSLRTLLRTITETGRPIRDAEVELRLGSGAAAPPSTFIISLETLDGDGGRLVIVSLQDITERRAATQRVEALNRLLATIRDINQLIVRETDRDRLLSQACRIAVEHAVYDLVAIALVDPATGGVAPAAASAPLPGLGRDHPAVPLLEEAVAGSTTLVRNLKTGNIGGSHTEAAQTGSALAVPLTAKGEVVGAIAVLSSQPTAFDDEVVVLFEELAGDLGFALGALEDAAERAAAGAEIRRLNAVLEERVRQRTEQLELANRELESFSYSISHDLRAPLRAIRGFAELLDEAAGDQLGDDPRGYLGQIRAGAEELEALIGHVLGFSRLTTQPLRAEEVATTALVRLVWEELAEARAGRDIELVCTELPESWGDRVLLKQVLVNLLGNAVKFTRTREQARVEVAGSSDGATLTLSVRDNGVGFDPAQTDRLFGAFQRLHHHGEFEGTGVGLAIVKRIVTRHGGRVWAESAPGEGATFWVALPGSPAEHP